MNDVRADLRPTRGSKLGAIEIEMRNAERARDLITLEEAIESNQGIVGLTRIEFGGLPARITRDLELRRQIEKAVNDSFARIADRLRVEAAALRSGKKTSIR